LGLNIDNQLFEIKYHPSLWDYALHAGFTNCSSSFTLKLISALSALNTLRMVSMVALLALLSSFEICDF
jgi:hypothetical protein